LSLVVCLVFRGHHDSLLPVNRVLCHLLVQSGLHVDFGLTTIGSLSIFSVLSLTSPFHVFIEVVEIILTLLLLHFILFSQLSVQALLDNPSRIDRVAKELVHLLMVLLLLEGSILLHVPDSQLLEQVGLIKFHLFLKPLSSHLLIQISPHASLVGKHLLFLIS